MYKDTTEVTTTTYVPSLRDTDQYRYHHPVRLNVRRETGKRDQVTLTFPSLETQPRGNAITTVPLRNPEDLEDLAEIVTAAYRDLFSRQDHHNEGEGTDE